MSETGKTSSLYSVSDTRGYYYKIRSYCDLYRYHEIFFMEQNGHPYNNKLPEIIHVQDTTEDLERYYEILYNVLNLDVDKRTKYDVVAKITNTVGDVPDLGIEVMELTDFYHCGDLISGLFMYRVNYDSTAYWAGFEEGDVIIKVKRPEVESKPSRAWKLNTFTVTCPTPGVVKILDPSPRDFKTYEITTVDSLMNMFSWCRNNELVIFTVVRDGQEMTIPVNVPFKSKVIKRVNVPQIVIKTVPVFEIDGGMMIMNQLDVNNDTNKVAQDNMNNLFNRIHVDISGDGNLVMETPDTLNEVDFYISNDGILYTRYD